MTKPTPAGVGQLPAMIQEEQTPFIGGMDFTMSEPDTLRAFLQSADVAFRKSQGAFALIEPEVTANTVFRFFGDSQPN